MSEIIERLTKAIVLKQAEIRAAYPYRGCACLGKDKPEDPGCVCEMANASALARVVIEAMREPTAAMTAAAFKHADDSGGEVYPGSDYGPMIDAALK